MIITTASSRPHVPLSREAKNRFIAERILSAGHKSPRDRDWSTEWNVLDIMADVLANIYYIGHHPDEISVSYRDVWECIISLTKLGLIEETSARVATESETIRPTEEDSEFIAQARELFDYPLEPVMHFRTYQR